MNTCRICGGSLLASAGQMDTWDRNEFDSETLPSVLEVLCSGHIRKLVTDYRRANNRRNGFNRVLITQGDVNKWVSRLLLQVANWKSTGKVVARCQVLDYARHQCFRFAHAKLGKHFICTTHLGVVNHQGTEYSFTDSLVTSSKLDMAVSMLLSAN